VRLREILRDARFFSESLKIFVSERCGTEVMPKIFTTEAAEDTEHESDYLLLPIFAVNHTFDSVAEVCHVKVDQQANANTTQPHIRQ
jgi:hypothetical protein